MSDPERSAKKMPAKQSQSLFGKHVSLANKLMTYVVANHLLIEHLLIRGITAKLQRPSALFDSRPPNFAMLVSIADALGIIDADFARVLRCVNGLRNRYAHRLSYKPEEPEVAALQKALLEMERPFLMSMVPPSEREMMRMMASVSGHLQRIVEGGS